MLSRAFYFMILTLLLSTASAEDVPPLNKETYVHAVTRGAGLLPGQDAHPSPEEAAFRASMEARKDTLLARSNNVAHPALYTPADLARARANAGTSAWAKGWRDNQVALADAIVAQPEGWITAMIPLETPAHGYGFTCPKCVGDKSQEAVGYSLAKWTYTDPDRLTCRACGQTYPDAAYPESAKLVMPRMGHEVTYYLNEDEQADPDDRTGRNAWHWVGYPIHVSFTGLIRERKVGFMRDAVQSLALAYAFTDDVRYAVAARDILVRFAEGYCNWLYRDYWDTYADCDPLYAAWHDKALPLTWKRHLSEQAFAKDTVDRATMRQTYWGAGRVHPSTGAISGVPALALAYDLTCAAMQENGLPVWSPEQRATVERDLLLEYIFEAEPYVGGPDAATNANNKAPRIYNAMAFVAKCLGIARLADTALRGYEVVRDDSFNADGFCTESPSYNNMYLSQLLRVPETLHGFQWPEGFDGRTGAVDYYASDAKLRRMYRAVLWTLLPSGHYLPLSDTHVHARPSAGIVHLGMRRYPDMFAGVAPLLGADTMGQYAVFQLTEGALQEKGSLDLPETCFPDWGTAILRYGDSTVTLAFNPWGGHRHYDNLALFYDVGGKTLLGDHGYVGDMPVNTWIKSTLSHNLVVVDGGQQERGERVPRFEFMATSPLASVVEASSKAYAQCDDYRRRAVLVKGPDGQSFVVDLFRVRGGKEHRFRTFSEVASSDAPEGILSFTGVDMPKEPPLPEVGPSLARADIYGLRDVRAGTPDGDIWQATWDEEGAAYRLWMLTPCDRVEASNGPGQRDLREAGRRVRYLDAVREGEDLESTFVAVHAGGNGDGMFPVREVRRLAVKGAPDAVAVEIETAFGTYYALNDFPIEAEAAGIRFAGAFALVGKTDSGTRCLTVGARMLSGLGLNVADPSPTLDAAVIPSTHDGLTLPAGDVHWPHVDGAVSTWVAVESDGHAKGYPVGARAESVLTVAAYPLPKTPVRARMHAVRFVTTE